MQSKERAQLLQAQLRSLALIPIGAVLVVVAATSIAARLATRIHTADALRYE